MIHKILAVLGSTIALVGCSAAPDEAASDSTASPLGAEEVAIDINKIVFADVREANWGTVAKYPWKPEWNRYIAEAIAAHGKALVSSEKPVGAMKELCPLYDSATMEERTAMFALLFAEIARYESAYKTNDSFAEDGQCRKTLPFTFTAPVLPEGVICDEKCLKDLAAARSAARDAACSAELATYKGRPETREARPHQNFSEGLLSVSIDDGDGYAECEDVRAPGGTFDPKKNLWCGVGILAKKIRTANTEGRAFVMFPPKVERWSYWSVLTDRDPTPAELARNPRKKNLGKAIKNDFAMDSGKLKNCRTPR